MAMDRGGIQRDGMDRGGVQAPDYGEPPAGIAAQGMHHHRMNNRAGYITPDTLLAVVLVAALSEIVGRWL